MFVFFTLLFLPLLVGAPQPSDGGRSSSAVLAQLPDEPIKRQFIIDCTNCHQFTAAHAYPGGRVRTRDEWLGIVHRMRGYAGPQTTFPVMSAALNPDSVASWLARHFVTPQVTPIPLAATATVARGEVREFLLPAAGDLAHDVAVDSTGTVLVTGMFTNRMHSLDTTSGQFRDHPIPRERANPRAVEIAGNGDWWVLLGAANAVAQYEVRADRWRFFDIGMYGHSLALQGDSAIWFNGHFTHTPELVGFVNARSGTVTTAEAPTHPRLAGVGGGPIPYELRAARDGRLWMSELQGNRLLSYDPGARSWTTVDMPAATSGPRRFDVASDGAVWIPAYADNALWRFDPTSRTFTRFVLPRRDAVPYVARVSGGTVWIGTNASDEVYAFDIATERFRVYALPTAGAVIRHMVVHPLTGDLWLAYGASPGIPARIARLRPER